MYRRSRRQWVIRWPGGERIAVDQSQAGAWREALEYEQRLNNPSHAILDWSTAADSYEEWYLAQWSVDHRQAWQTARRRLEAFFEGHPPDIPAISNRDLAAFAAHVSSSCSVETVRGYCRYLRGFFNWCVEQEWIESAPRVRLQRRRRGEKRSKGRPLTMEEFERMYAVVADVVGPQNAESWRFLLTGLWETSLRLREATQLHWSDGDVRMNLTGQFPMIEFLVGDKGGHPRLPITPGFMAALEGAPRRGFVFRPRLSRGVTRCRDTWSHKIGEFGRKAGVIVDSRTGKRASAHDLRRSFLQRWRNKVDATVLQILARHESFDTTRQYYLGDDAQRVAAAIWRGGDLVES